MANKLALTDIALDVFRSNWSNRHSEHDSDDDAHFRRCWARQDCRSCLGQSACSWCPFTSVCVPNDYAVPALAPALDDKVCPYWAERWELRTRPLGCQVSTITSLTALVAGASTLVVALLIWLLVRSVRWGRQRWHQRKAEGKVVSWPLWLGRKSTSVVASSAEDNIETTAEDPGPSRPQQASSEPDEQTPLLSTAAP